MTTALNTLVPVPGFEQTSFAYVNGRLVWAEIGAMIEHPRNWHYPWNPLPKQYKKSRLKQGAKLAWEIIQSNPTPGLLAWLAGKSLSFSMENAVLRFDAVLIALKAKDLINFEKSATRVIGLGNGLTPSGDDFLGGIFFALHYAPIKSWSTHVEGLHARIKKFSVTGTNSISAALLNDLMCGRSYRVLHDLLSSLESCNVDEIDSSLKKLLKIGASSGADMLAGVLLALNIYKPSLNPS